MMASRVLRRSGLAVRALCSVSPAVAKPRRSALAVLRAPARAPLRRNATQGKPKTSQESTAKSMAESKASPEDELMERPLTASETVSAGFTLSLLAFGTVCFGFTVYALWPTGISPNGVFDEAFAQLGKDERVLRTFGEPLKAYGHDSGGHREGRRNFVVHREEKGEDGSKRMKVRFNVKGPYSGGIVYAEASNQLNMRQGEWVYLIVQDKMTGKVITICDNRSSLALAASAKSPEEKEAMMRLLKGSDNY
uniref:Mitochondrial import inner membrane translocase subunit Tim21 n=1 Tax=Rhizochromulina marina TaxID=1034831 RepID=A0A7S2W907_9STRA